jgi:hypothetical protein
MPPFCTVGLGRVAVAVLVGAAVFGGTIVDKALDGTCDVLGAVLAGVTCALAAAVGLLIGATGEAVGFECQRA